MNRRRDARMTALLVMVVSVALVAPILLPSPSLRIVTTAVAMAVAVLGVNLMGGYLGRVALGHGAFVGTGAYTAVILSADHHWPIVATIPAAAVVCFAVGLVVGVPALRIKGLHLALVTLALGASFGPIVKRLGFLTNGPNGKGSTAAWVAPTWLGEGRRADGRWFYLVAVAVAAMVFVLVRNLTVGRVGRGVLAVRDGELAAVANGVPASRYIIAMFGCSAAIAGVAGALLMIQSPFAAHTNFESSFSLHLYAAATVGGLATINGAVVGGALLVGLPYLSARLGINLNDNVIFGGTLIVAVALFPAGLGTVFSGLVRRSALLPSSGPGPIVGGHHQ